MTATNDSASVASATGGRRRPSGSVVRIFVFLVLAVGREELPGLRVTGLLDAAVLVLVVAVRFSLGVRVRLVRGLPAFLAVPGRFRGARFPLPAGLSARRARRAGRPRLPLVLWAVLVEAALVAIARTPVGLVTIGRLVPGSILVRLSALSTPLSIGPTARLLLPSTTGLTTAGPLAVLPAASTLLAPTATAGAPLAPRSAPSTARAALLAARAPLATGSWCRGALVPARPRTRAVLAAPLSVAALLPGSLLAPSALVATTLLPASVLGSTPLAALVSRCRPLLCPSSLWRLLAPLRSSVLGLPWLGSLLRVLAALLPVTTLLTVPLSLSTLLTVPMPLTTLLTVLLPLTTLLTVSSRGLGWLLPPRPPLLPLLWAERSSTLARLLCPTGGLLTARLPLVAAGTALLAAGLVPSSTLSAVLALPSGPPWFPLLAAVAGMPL